MPRVGIALLVLMSTASCGDDRNLLAWSLGVQTFDSTALGLTTGTVAPDPRAAAITPSTRIDVPTYEHSGQVVHPDVLLEPDRLVLAITPYPYANNRFENPSLLASVDGMAFDELPAGENPLVPAPPIGHNDDPDLHRDPQTGDYELLYLETLRPDTQNLISLRSRDLVTWSREIAIGYDLAGGDAFIVSPAAIVEHGTTHLFYVHLADHGIIETLTSADGRTWDKAASHPIDLDLGAVAPWHLDVFACPTGYGMLISGFDEAFVHQNLYLATSPDLVSWTLRPEPLLAHDDPALGVESLYRSTGLVLGNQLVVWYSMQYRE